MSFKQNLQFISKNPQLLKGYLCGLERECLRVNQKGDIAQTPHPHKLGSPLTHPYITTDYSEAQLELVTPPLKTPKAAVDFLKDLHCFISKNLNNELLWPFSMPSRLPKSEKDIPIAQYGTSFAGQKRTKYREGLADRYGRKMQTVCGIHYNFSFSDPLFEKLSKFQKNKKSIQEFRSAQYFNTIRNFLRNSWLNTYLFGATPAVDKTYLKKFPKPLKKLNSQTYYAPHATSLRMSNIGYYSKVQAQLNISYNSLSQFLQDMHFAITTPVSKYQKYAGLNSNKLQIPNEHYSRIRPKRASEKPMLQALQQDGVQYLEIRAVDVNPFLQTGIAEEQLLFLNCFLLLSLLETSPKIDQQQAKELTANQQKVALYGRKPSLTLQRNGKQIPLQTWAKQLLQKLSQIAEIFDKTHKTKKYSKAIAAQLQKLQNPELLPSAKLLKHLQKNKTTYLQHGLELAHTQTKNYSKCAITQYCHKHLKDTAKQSIKQQKDQEFIDSVYLDESHQDLELSTQLLLKEAKKRKIKFSILNRPEHFIQLKKGFKTRYIKQATFTQLDSQISYFITSSKPLTKTLLHKAKINVPQGQTFQTLSEAHQFYPQVQHQHLVIKPSDTNYGQGITMLQPNKPKQYLQALQTAFALSSQVIVEQFIPGKEYRFLVIDKKCIAVLHRIPANVTGDGTSTISQLIDLKNANPKNYKFFKGYSIPKSPAVKTYLKTQKLQLTSIIPKGKTIFLLPNSNVSTGGDAHDYTKKAHKTYKKIAEQAAKIAEASICGVDMIVSNITKPATQDNYSIIELNYNPNLQIHAFPLKGEVINVAAKVLDALGF